MSESTQEFEYDSLGYPYCPKIKLGRGGVRYKARCVGCPEECEFREEIEAIVEKRMSESIGNLLVQAKKSKEVQDGRLKVILTVGRKESIDKMKLLFENAGCNVLEVHIREALCDDVLVVIPNDQNYKPWPSQAPPIPEVQIFEPKVDIKAYFAPLTMEEEKRRQRADRRQQNKFAQRFFLKRRKK